MRALKHLFKSADGKRAIEIREFCLSHKRLTQSEDLLILFSFKRMSFRKRMSSRGLTAGSSLKIDKICIQKKSDQRFETFDACANEFLNLAENKLIFSLNDIFQLIPVSIPKPWGKEIWYSGIESRGVSRIRVLSSRGLPAVPRAEGSSGEVTLDPVVKPRGDIGSIPLSWIAALTALFLGKKFAKKDPILIKILDPNPQEVIGDLYYELHQEKNEVYIVTDIAGSQGKIKIGINPEKLKFYSGDKQKYKTDFLKSILNYEKTRREIDQLIQTDQPPSNLLKEQEILFRKEMDSFCGYANLKIGDVIHVPTHVPHALQHGVKVIEFQTPTYERLIISFAQKVLTQSHWDTKQAFDMIRLEHFQKQTLKILSKTKHILKELVCVFPEFKVQRWTLNCRTKCKIPKKSHYRILFVISGEIFANGVKLLAEMCVLIPQNAEFIVSSEQLKQKPIFILAEPT